MNIISASRRTDIPAFYSEWFMGRVRAGNAQYVNPFSRESVSVSLSPEEVHSIVFWTKNFAPMLPYMDELDGRGFNFMVLYTITGLPEAIEQNVPAAMDSVDIFRRVSKRYSEKHVTWRFDPILVSDLTPIASYEQRFELLASALEGATDRCIVSFVEFYGKVQKNLGALEKSLGIRVRNPEQDEKLELLGRLSDIAGQHGMTLCSCCDDSLVGEKVLKSHCIDGERLSTLFPDKPAIVKKNATRKGCGCTTSRDIGAYGTCRHMCAYCYANTSERQVERNSKRHNPEAESLLPIGKD